MTTFTVVMGNQMEDDPELVIDGDMLVSRNRRIPPNTIILIIGTLKWQGFESLS